MRKVPASFLALTLIAFYLNSAANAQSFTGTISGIVTDRSGGVVPQASITVVNTDTNSRTTAVSNEDGSYIAPQLPRGNYTLEVTAPGFKKSTRSGIVLQVQQQARVDVQLEVGEVGETIEVFADASLLETSDSTLGKVVDNRRIMDLPLDTRNVFSLIYLTPGVSGSVSTTYGTGYSINGARTSMLDTVVDGVSTGHPTVNGFAGNSTFPPVDAIAEFKLLGANYSAEFGRSLGNITNVVYKSGSNEFHGSAFEFLRNSALDANNFFDNSRGVELASFKRSQFGGHLTGPILRNRTFFLGSYEGLRQRGFDNRTFTVPTELERSGDFSQTFSRNGELIRIFDPFSTRPNPNGSGSVRDLFQNNRIPSSRIDPVAANVMRYYPLPNTQGDPLTNQNNYSRSGSRTFDNDQVDVRVDHNLTDTQRIFGRVSLRQMLNQPAVLFPEEIAVAEGRVNEETIQRSAVFDYTNTLSPSTIVSSRLGFSRSLYIYDNQGLGFKPSSLGLPESIDAAVDRQMFPRFGAGGYVNLGGNDHRYNAFMNYSLTGSLTKIVGAHTLKAGYEGRMIRVNVWEARSAGTFNFSSQFTQGPDPTRASATAGNSIASLLLGTGTSGNVLIQNWKNVAAQSFYHGAYV
ncbi:MAG: carboxypeptidase regulatory-like domain-containing protein, partial [Bryobacteraceae bacterium]